MKTYIYYSPSKKDVIAVIAENTLMAAGLMLKETNSKMSDDYYFVTSIDHKIGACGIFDVSAFDSLIDLKNECELNALESQTYEG